MASQQADDDTPLVVDPEQDDADSALGESAAGSFTESLSSSVLNYQYENGRRYHAYREGAYILPNDDTEQQRLDMLHHIYRIIAGGALHYAPLSEDDPPSRVLDLGTGTGIWAIHFADEHPNSIVVGTDLSPIQPSWLPPNCQFYVQDIESQWDYTPDEHFEYIHARGLCGSIANWPKLYRQAYDTLKPGGWIESQEFEPDIYSDDGTLALAPHLTSWLEELNAASDQFGKPLRIANSLKEWMEDAGFVDVQERNVKVPIGSWPKDKTCKILGKFYLAQFLDTVEPITLALFTRVLGYSNDEANIIVANVRNDLRLKRAHLWVPVRSVWGRKPTQ